eukprot:748699-Hanusia_phi.AAC.1
MKPHMLAEGKREGGKRAAEDMAGDREMPEMDSEDRRELLASTARTMAIHTPLSRKGVVGMQDMSAFDSR